VKRGDVVQRPVAPFLTRDVIGVDIEVETEIFSESSDREGPMPGADTSDNLRELAGIGDVRLLTIMMSVLPTW
jgi:hypothetical protein